LTSDRLFDAHLHPEGVPDQDLESLAFFGVRAALVAADPAPVRASSKAILEHFEEIQEEQLPRLEKAGIRGYAALGVHPRAIPRRGLTEVLSALPGFFKGGKVVAIGEIGLHDGGAVEEEAFLEQLALARRLKLPVLVHTPMVEKERITRRALILLRESGIAPAQVLVDHASGRTVRLILECGHFAGLTIHPDELTAERAVALVRRLGSGRLVLDSDSGDGAGDLLGLARVASLLRRAELSEKLVSRVTHQNATDFYRVS
jgi:predicted metal-dependent TIM-barrel fold hydrolase